MCEETVPMELSKVGFKNNLQKADPQECESPFYGVRSLLWFYSTIGILPVKISANCKKFQLQTWRYFLAPFLAFLLLVLFVIVGHVKYGKFGFAKKATERILKFTTLDYIVNLVQGYGLTICVLHTLHLTRKFVPFLEDIGKHLLQESQPSFKKLRFKHVILMILSVLLSILLESSIFMLAADDFYGTPEFWWIVFGGTINHTIIFLIIICPDLIILTVLESIIYKTKCLKEMSDSGKLSSGRSAIYFSGLENTYSAFRKTEKHLGLSMGRNVIINFCLLLYGIYSIVYVAIVIEDRDLATLAFVLSMFVFMAIAISRLVLLTDHIQDMNDSFKENVDILIELGANHKDGYVKANAKKYAKLLGPIDGISVHGYFIIDRKILINISSYVLTIIIILIEFKLNDLK